MAPAALREDGMRQRSCRTLNLMSYKRERKKKESKHLRIAANFPRRRPE